MEVHVFIKITAVKILLRYYSPCFISQGQWPPRAPYKLVQLNTYNDFTGVWTLSQQGNLIPMTQNGLQVYKLEHASLSLQKDAFVIILETTFEWPLFFGKCMELLTRVTTNNDVILTDDYD